MVMGMPIGPPSQSPDPKSACTGRLAPIERTIVREFDFRGSWPTGLFQTFVAGKSGQVGAPGSGTGAAVAGAGAAMTSAAPRRTTSLTISFSTRSASGSIPRAGRKSARSVST
jgi:hypothetical protein